jgi:site-specific DNA-methyltransferase (adenine-specific)
MNRVIGNASLFCGDCLDIIPTLGEVDAVVTDPPYSSGGTFTGDRQRSTREKYQSSTVQVEHPEFSGDTRDQRSFTLWSELWMRRCLRITRPGGALLAFTDWRQLASTIDALQVAGWVFRGIAPWDKVAARPMPDRFRAQCEYVVFGTNGPINARPPRLAQYHPGLISGAPPRNHQRRHTTQKPVGVLQTLLRIVPKGGTVLDPFMGSGTTGVAAVKEGLRFIGCEMVPRYFDIACDRITQAQA